MAQIVAAGPAPKRWWYAAGRRRTPPEASSGGNPREGPLPVDGQVLPPLPDMIPASRSCTRARCWARSRSPCPKTSRCARLGSSWSPTSPRRRAGAGERRADRGPARLPAAAGHRPGRGPAPAGTQHPRRRAAGPCRPGHQAPAGRDHRRCGSGQTGPVFGELKAGAAGALENLRDLARGIYPPLLADLGLAAALNAQASKSPLPVTVEADAIGRFGQDTEAAVYFCCLEALQNTAKYAHAAQARICLQAHNGTLSFTVSDDGTGYDTRRTPMGSGLRNMADRLAALSGQLEVRSAPAKAPSSPGTSPPRRHQPRSSDPDAANQRSPHPRTDPGPRWLPANHRLGSCSAPSCPQAPIPCETTAGPEAMPLSLS